MLKIMTDLKNKKCVPCEGKTPPLTAEEIATFLPHVKGWNVIENKKIEKNLTFVDFKHALGFINEVGDLAEFEGHHPDLSIHSWNKVTVTFYTHAAKGLTENDFIMAAKVDQIVEDTKEEAN